ncbi:sigma-70 family RNA polymerase sigma factor [Streptomyces sp. NPDC012756]|uniref:sigma-70 family RNA polymerase sigma factor n=1 Tax=Streptomyces sp. NPDC012756 TaxID=3364847 RepID=UPI0036A9E924
MVGKTTARSPNRAHARASEHTHRGHAQAPQPPHRAQPSREQLVAAEFPLDLRSAARHLAGSEPSYELIESLTALRPLLARLDHRDRRIPELRFGEELTQAETGHRVGLSQMHVSRLLTRILGELRNGLLQDDAATDRASG